MQGDDQASHSWPPSKSQVGLTCI